MVGSCDGACWKGICCVGGGGSGGACSGGCWKGICCAGIVAGGKPGPAIERLLDRERLLRTHTRRSLSTLIDRQLPILASSTFGSMHDHAQHLLKAATLYKIFLMHSQLSMK